MQREVQLLTLLELNVFHCYNKARKTEMIRKSNSFPSQNALILLVYQNRQLRMKIIQKGSDNIKDKTLIDGRILFKISHCTKNYSIRSAHLLKSLMEKFIICTVSSKDTRTASNNFVLFSLLTLNSIIDKFQQVFVSLKDPTLLLFNTSKLLRVLK